MNKYIKILNIRKTKINLMKKLSFLIYFIEITYLMDIIKLLIIIEIFVDIYKK